MTSVLAISRPSEACTELHRFGLDAVRLSDQAGAFPMWLVRVAQPPSDGAIAVLSGSEIARAERFHTEPLRNRYVAAHAALRLLGEQQFGISAARQRWVANDCGKPRLADVPSAQCSLSYTGNHAVIAWSVGAEIGVDVEFVRPIEDAAELMAAHYTVAEQRALRVLQGSPAVFDRAFLTVWVRKEACVKALGEGLGIPLTEVHCGLGQPRTQVQVGDERLCTGVFPAESGLLVAWARRSGSAVAQDGSDRGLMLRGG